MAVRKRSNLLKGYIASMALSLFYLLIYGRTLALAALVVGAVFTECLFWTAHPSVYGILAFGLSAFLSKLQIIEDWR
jgi:hypothetical protein